MARAEADIIGFSLGMAPDMTPQPKSRVARDRAAAPARLRSSHGGEDVAGGAADANPRAGSGARRSRRTRPSCVF
ncbi:hypothetical protein C7S16_6517 [Burkholderia thailandensis]|uniref:Uncharacterized protein n=1 Tax=Burkholderia thailandensis TaxID=57975 RepID=A0AAW9CSN0_BURTH|nr:hypothetical protein [Burkholderia thailandensis]MDW9250809.1 hypothetical protein [Burkholderia thailandensis]